MVYNIIVKNFPICFRNCWKWSICKLLQGQFQQHNSPSFGMESTIDDVVIDSLCIYIRNVKF